MRLSVQLFASQNSQPSAVVAVLEVVELAREADDLGYDTVWFAEHHGTPWNACPNPLTLAAFVAASTSRILLGTAVVNLTLHNPVAIAERAALVHGLSEGRLRLGIGRGFATADYLAYGIDPAAAVEVFSEQHREFRAALSAGPTPVPPVSLATTGSPAALAMAAQHRYGLLLAGHGAKLFNALTSFDSQWRQRHSDIPETVLFRAVHVADSAGRARDELVPYLAWYIDQVARLQPDRPVPAVDEVLETFCVLGTADECGEAITRLRTDAGPTELACVFGIGGAPLELTRGAMRRFAEEVAPQIRPLGSYQQRGREAYAR